MGIVKDAVVVNHVLLMDGSNSFIVPQVSNDVHSRCVCRWSKQLGMAVPGLAHMSETEFMGTGFFVLIADQ